MACARGKGPIAVACSTIYIATTNLEIVELTQNQAAAVRSENLIYALRSQHVGMCAIKLLCLKAAYHAFSNLGRSDNCAI